MPQDMLVKLYALPALEPFLARPRQNGITIRRGLAPEKHIITNWVREHFYDRWASECDIAMGHMPPSCFLATQDGRIAGFACFDCTARAFFGPTGVDESLRGMGIGAALLVTTLYAMRETGYGYAIIAAAGPTEFYRKTIGAMPIEDSFPGVYHDMLGIQDLLLE